MENFEKAQKTSMGEMVSKFGNWCKGMLYKSLEVDFCVTRNERLLLKVPVLVFVLALLMSFGFFMFLLVVGLFCDCKYYFQGIVPTTIDLNQLCEQASETCEDIKRDFQAK